MVEKKEKTKEKKKKGRKTERKEKKKINLLINRRENNKVMIKRNIATIWPDVLIRLYLYFYI